MELSFPPHKCSLYMFHNQHLNYYESIEEYLDRVDNKEDLISEEEGQRCIDTGEVWELQWYPDTPVGFYRVVGSTLEAVLKAAAEE